MRIQLHYGVNDLAGAHVNMALPHRPPSPGPVRPLDGGIANVHRVRTLRQVLDTHRVPEARLLKRRIPPQRPHARSRTDRLRNGAVKIKHNRLHRLADYSVRIFLLQTPAVHQVTRERPIVGLGKILKASAAESHSQILLPGFISGRGHGHKRMVLADAQGMRIGLVQIALRIGSKRQERFHFGVERKAAGVFEINYAAVFVQPPVGRLRRLLPHHDATHGAARPAQL